MSEIKIKTLWRSYYFSSTVMINGSQIQDVEFWGITHCWAQGTCDTYARIWVDCVQNKCLTWHMIFGYWFSILYLLQSVFNIKQSTYVHNVDVQELMIHWFHRDDKNWSPDRQLQKTRKSTWKRVLNLVKCRIKLNKSKLWKLWL